MMDGSIFNYGVEMDGSFAHDHRRGQTDADNVKSMMDEFIFYYRVEMDGSSLTTIDGVH